MDSKEKSRDILDSLLKVFVFQVVVKKEAHQEPVFPMYSKQVFVERHYLQMLRDFVIIDLSKAQVKSFQQNSVWFVGMEHKDFRKDNCIYIPRKSNKIPYEVDDVYLDLDFQYVKHTKFNLIGNRNIEFEYDNFHSIETLQQFGYAVKMTFEGKNYLISYDDILKFSIGDYIYTQKEHLISNLSDKISQIEGTSKESIICCYKDKYLNTILEEENENIEAANEVIETEFYENKTQKFLIHHLCHKYCQDIKFEEQNHQFVISNTEETENEEFGRRAELVVNWYLEKYFEGMSWFYYDETNATDYEDYPYDQFDACRIDWNNGLSESFMPYDFSLTLANIKYKIEVKATRGDDQTIFYLTIGELEELIKEPNKYFIFRLFLIKENCKDVGIPLNEEFYGKFYRIKPDTLKEVTKSIKKWKEYYKENSIRFTLSQFEAIPDEFVCDSHPQKKSIPDVSEKKYWINFSEFVYGNYFQEFENSFFQTENGIKTFVNGFMSYLESGEVKSAWDRYQALKKKCMDFDEYSDIDLEINTSPLKEENISEDLLFNLSAIRLHNRTGISEMKYFLDSGKKFIVK